MNYFGQLLAASGLVAGLAVLGVAAQDPAGRRGGPPPERREQDPPPPPPPGNDPPQRPGRMMGPPRMDQMSATGKFVYVLRGDELMQFDATSLAFVKKVRLPQPERHDGPPEGGRGPRE